MEAANPENWAAAMGTGLGVPLDVPVSGLFGIDVPVTTGTGLDFEGSMLIASTRRRRYLRKFGVVSRAFASSASVTSQVKPIYALGSIPGSSTTKQQIITMRGPTGEATSRFLV